MRSVSIEEARRTLGDLIDRARLADEPTMVTRNGKPGAVIVGPEWFSAAQADQSDSSDGPDTAQGGDDQT